MKTKKKLPLILAAIAVTVLFASLTVSCTSTGNFLPISPGEPIIGIVQTNFAARKTVNDNTDTINTLAYIKLLEAAQEKYEEDARIDIRDIVWVSGEDIDGGTNKKYSAAGKVIRIK